MRKRLSATGLGLAVAASAQAADKIVPVNMSSLFQRVAQRAGVSSTLENEFKGHTSELQRMKGDLQSKMQRLQSMKPGTDRTRPEKDVVAQCQIFPRKTQAFEQDRACHPSEEHGELATRIQIAVQSVARDQSIDLVVDANAIVYNGSDIGGIIADMLKQVR